MASMRMVTAAFLTLLLCWSWTAAADVAVPALTGRVVDRTATLTPDQIASLDQTLKAFEQRKGTQIAVLIVPTTEPESIEQFSIRVAEAWKIGRKKIDDGALLVVAKNDRRLRIEVGYGLEGALTDVTAKRIIDEIITPKFRSGDFAGGVSDGVARMIAVADGEAPPPPKLPPPPLKPPPDPPEKPPPLPPDQPPRPPPNEPTLSLTSVRKNATIAVTSETARVPTRNHAIAPTSPPVTMAPSSLTNIARKIPPRINPAMKANGIIDSMLSSAPGARCVCAGGGSASPSATAIIRATPSEIPPAKSPLRNFGVMTSSMMRLAVTSVSAPSRP